MADVSINGDVEIVKELGPPQLLWAWSDFSVFDYKGFPNNTSTKLLLGHNRAATQGKITAENAHPFEFDGLIGAHNGTLDDWTIRNFAEYKNHDVDSHVLFEILNNKGVDEMYKNISGAMALTWYDKDEKQLHFLRNSQRPLFYAYDKEGTAILWASEMVFLVGACVRAGLELSEEGVQSVPPDTLLTFKPLALSCEKMEDRELEKKTYATKASGSSGFWGGTKVTVGATQSKFGSSWKKGTRKASKGVPKNVSIRLGHLAFFDGAAICHAKIIDTETPLIIHFGDNYNPADTRSFLDNIRAGNRLYETKSRMRVKTEDKKETYHIFHSGVRALTKDATLITPNTPLPPEQVVRAKVESNVIALHTKPAYRGERISENLFNRRIAEYNGCCPSCGNPVLWESAEDVVWLSYTKYTCKDCSEDELAVEQVMNL